MGYGEGNEEEMSQNKYTRKGIVKTAAGAAKNPVFFRPGLGMMKGEAHNWGDCTYN